VENKALTIFWKEKKMKKLLILVLVLRFTSLVNADFPPITSPMKLVANEELTSFGIDLPIGMSGNPVQYPPVGDGSGGYWAIIGVNTDSGAMSADGITYSSTGGNCTLDLSSVDGDAGNTLLFNYGEGVWGCFATSSTSSWSTAAGIYADSFTPLEGATEVKLYVMNDGMTYKILKDTIVISEPATLLLFGIGGFVLRRKKH
jgi:hypothetical protein